MQLLVADYLLLLLSSILLPLLYRGRKDKFKKCYSTLLKRLSPLTEDIKRRLLWTLPWICLLLCLLIALSRRSIFALGYLTAAFYLLINYVDVFLDITRAHRYWTRILWFTFCVLVIHVLWVLPALLIDWSSAIAAILNFLQFVGFRDGMNIKLKDTDPRIRVWTVNGGFLCDFLLFLLITPLRHLLNDATALETASKFADNMAIAKRRANVGSLPFHSLHPPPS